jgi:ATP-dependent Lon protease
MGNITIPLLSLRDIVVYPHMLIPLFVGREKSILALEEAMRSGHKQILLVTQKDARHDDPNVDELYNVGTVANVLQLLKLPDDTVKVLVEGVARGKILSYHPDEKFLLVDISIMQADHIDGEEKEALMRSIFTQFEQFAKLNNKVYPELISSVAAIDDLERLVDAIAAQIPLKIQDKQKILETERLVERVKCLMGILEVEIDLLQIQVKIRGDIKQKMEDDHRKYYLTEQKKAIDKQLGEMSGNSSSSEPEELEKKILHAGMPKEAEEKALAELDKLKLSSMGPEATQSRNYIDWMVKLPWKNTEAPEISLEAAEQILNTEHYGLEKVKERILEYLAVQKRVKKVAGSVLCLVGPPGVGKTSLGRSIAHATQREYARIALGGLRDEAEIRGHRKTYIGSMPGKILQKLAKVGVNNPLFLLDEVDKMAMDYRGDPASALLEVLDSEQNHSFNDHYLEVDYDLSNVMFVCTSNSLNIPAALLDRMEVIRIAGYTEDEKLNIANHHLIVKQKELAGLQDHELKIPDSVIIDIIRYYTRESGVRNLEREIAKICRKTVKKIQLDSTISGYILSSENL